MREGENQPAVARMATSLPPEIIHDELEPEWVAKLSKTKRNQKYKTANGKWNTAFFSDFPNVWRAIRSHRGKKTGAEIGHNLDGQD